MATAGSWRIYGAVTGLVSGTRTVDVSIPASVTAVDVTQQVIYGGAGFTAFTVPANATAVIIIPPTANAQALTLKGVTGDTGIPISKTAPTVIAVGAAAALGVTAAGAVTLTLLWM